MITARCPSCSHEYRIPPTFVGKKIKCKQEGCGQVFKVTEEQIKPAEVIPEPQYWIKRTETDEMFGPMSEENLKRAAKSGQLSPEDMVGQSQNGPWQPLKNMKGISLPDKSVSLESGTDEDTYGYDEEYEDPSLPPLHKRENMSSKQSKLESKCTEFPGSLVQSFLDTLASSSKGDPEPLSPEIKRLAGYAYCSVFVLGSLAILGVLVTNDATISQLAGTLIFLSFIAAIFSILHFGNDTALELARIMHEVQRNEASLRM